MRKRDLRRKSKHHRRPVSLGGSNNARNISIVPVHKHRSYHSLFDNNDVFEIARILNEVWIDPDYQFIVIRKTD